eukprot:tig00001003_g6270.t1
MNRIRFTARSSARIPRSVVRCDAGANSEAGTSDAAELEATPPPVDKSFPPSLLSSPLDPRAVEWFAAEAAEATVEAVDSGMKRMTVFVQIPELDPSVDVYRLRSVLQVAWELVLSLAGQGKRVKVCIQGQGQQFGGMPLSVAGIRRALEGDLRVSLEDGTHSSSLENVRISGIGAASVEEEDEIFLLISPTNTIGQAVIDDVRAMAAAAGERPFIMLNPRLADVPSYEGIMGVQGRAERLAFLATFDYSYYFRLLYVSGTDYPIRGALYRKYPSAWEVFSKDEGAERYRLLSVQADRPEREQLAGIFERANSGGEAAQREAGALAATVAAALVLGAAALAAVLAAGPLPPQ